MPGRVLLSSGAILLTLTRDISTSALTDQGKELFSVAEDRGQISLAGSEKFRLLDQFSDAHSLSDYTDKKSVFLVAVNKKYVAKNETVWLRNVPTAPDSATVLITSTIGESYSDYERMNFSTLFRSHFCDKGQYPTSRDQI